MPAPFDRRAFLTLSAATVLALTLAPKHPRAAMTQPEPTQEKRAAGADEITLCLTGDVMTGRGIDQVLPYPNPPHLCETYVGSALEYVRLAEAANGAIAKPVNFGYIWGDALPELARRAPDVRIINLETSVTTNETCLPKGINYRMNPDNIGCISAAGIDCCVLANNHVLDWDRAGLLETLDTLEAAGLRWAGAGRTKRDAAAPAVLDIPGKGRVLVFSFGADTSGIPRDWAAQAETPGVNLLPDLSDETARRVARDVAAAKRPGDVVVTSFHWGGNWGYHVPGEQRRFAHRLIDEAGVDVVHGHSSHHAKGIEVYKEKPILYGCGDLLNDYEGIGGYEEFRTDLALMYFPTLDTANGRLRRLDMVPFQIRKMRLNRAGRDDARWLQNTLGTEGIPFDTRVDLHDDNSLSLIWQ